MMLSTAQKRNIIMAIERALDEFYGTCPRAFMVNGLTVNGEQVKLSADGIRPKGLITVEAGGDIKVEQ